MQQVSKQLDVEPPLTVRAVADLLAISREAVTKRKDLPLVEGGGRPARIAAAVAIQAFEQRLDEIEATLQQLLTAYQRLFPNRPLATHRAGEAGGRNGGQFANQLQHRIDELSELLNQEKVGRGVAEARIEELKANLRRARAAIVALSPDPDMDPDRPAEQLG